MSRVRKFEVIKGEAPRPTASTSDAPILTPEELLSRAQNGDQEAFRQLVEPYVEKMLAQAFYTLQNREDAQDILQESLVKAFLNLKSFRGDSSLRTWLYRITANMCIDLTRKKKIKTIDLNEIEPRAVKDDDAKRPDEVFAQQEELRLIYGALETLSPEHRQTVVMREIDGLSYDEIAEATSVSVGTVMSRLHYGRKVLAEKLRRVLGM